MATRAGRRSDFWVPASVVAVAAALPVPNLLQGPARLAIIGLGVGIAVVRIVEARLPVDLLRQRLVTGAVAAFVVAGLVAVLTSPRPLLSWFGDVLTTRGLVLYVLLSALALAAATQSDRSARPLLYAVTAAAGVIAAVALLQWGNIGFQNLQVAEYAGAPGTLGNPNFAAGWLGAAVAAPVWVALEQRHQTGWRVTAAVVVVAAVSVIALTQAFQGPIVLAASLAVLGLARSLDLPRRRRMVASSVIGLVAVVALVAVLAGASGNGPLAGLMSGPGIQLRQDYWATAVRMGADNPVTGVGFERYGFEYRQYRTAEAAARVPVDSIADAAHNVPLHLFATGGLPLLATYLALVGLTTVAGVQALGRASSAHQRHVVAAVLALWAGYHAQSLVSIDDPALAVLGWVTGGTLVGLWAAGRQRRVTARTRTRRPSARLRGVTWGAAAVIAVIAVTPFVVEYVSGARLGGTPEQVLARIDRSAGLAPWEPRYPRQEGSLALEEGLGERAEQAFVETNQRIGGDFAATLSLARTLAALDDIDGARAAYERALQYEPSHPRAAEEVAEFMLEHGHTDRASEIIGAAIADHPGDRRLLDLRERLASTS